MLMAAVQLRSKLLNREETIRNIVRRIHESSDAGAELIVFPLASVPGYPIWLDLPDVGMESSALQKKLHTRYIHESVIPAHGHLESICAAAAVCEVDVVLGTVEHATDRGHSLYCSTLWIDRNGNIPQIHRSLMQEGREKLVWAAGDAAGLRTRKVGPFRVGILNASENWMPLARAGLQADGMDVQLMLWPGKRDDVRDITRFAAQEGRSYAISVCGALQMDDLPKDLRSTINAEEDGVILEGGICAAGPNGEWINDPDEGFVAGEEEIMLLELDPDAIAAERMMSDPGGHSSRPDVLHVQIDRRRQSPARFIDDAVDTSGLEPAIESLDHLVLTVRDIEKTARFFRTALGLEEVQDSMGNRAMKFGAQKIMLHAQDEDRSPLGHAPTPGSADICLLSKTPVEDWAERFNRTGIRVEMGPVERRGATGPLKTIYIRDPDGNLIELSNRIAFKPPAVDLPPSIPSNATISNSE